MNAQTKLREHALSIWQAAVDAVRPQPLIGELIADENAPLMQALESARRILVVGGGKAGVAMASAIEKELASLLDRVEGVVNVPGNEQGLPELEKIRLLVARPAGTNQPTAEGVGGTRQILELVGNADPEDVVLCLISGGGSALLPAPFEGITLEDKQRVTKLLHKCGATINEMNCVRKHLSAIKGGRLAQRFTGRELFSLIISDVIGDPLDVIASGPTAPDPTTFEEAKAVLTKFQLWDEIPESVRSVLEKGIAGQIPETAKQIPDNVSNYVLGNNGKALSAAENVAENLGYKVLNLGSFIEGETREVAIAFAGIVRSIQTEGIPNKAPVCLLSGGETTVTLGEGHGLGGRNQEFVLAMLNHLPAEDLKNIVLLSGGTDGEDGPCDAAGAMGDEQTRRRAAELGLSVVDYLDRHDAYHFFEQTGDLIKTGLTHTNVMDVRVILVDG